MHFDKQPSGDCQVPDLLPGYQRHFLFKGYSSGLLYDESLIRFGQQGDRQFDRLTARPFDQGGLVVFYPDKLAFESFPVDGPGEGPTQSVGHETGRDQHHCEYGQGFDLHDLGIVFQFPGPSG